MGHLGQNAEASETAVLRQLGAESAAAAVAAAADVVAVAAVVEAAVVAVAQLAVTLVPTAPAWAL